MNDVTESREASTSGLSERMQEVYDAIDVDLRSFAEGMDPEDFKLRLERHRNQLLCAIEDEGMIDD